MSRLNGKDYGAQVQAKARGIVGEFLLGKLQDMEALYVELQPSQKARLLVELTELFLPKTKTEHSTDPENSRGVPDFSKMSDQDLRELDRLQKLIIWKER